MFFNILLELQLYATYNGMNPFKWLKILCNIVVSAVSTFERPRGPTDGTCPMVTSWFGGRGSPWWSGGMTCVLQRPVDRGPAVDGGGPGSQWDSARFLESFVEELENDVTPEHAGTPRVTLVLLFIDKYGFSFKVIGAPLTWSLKNRSSLSIQMFNARTDNAWCHTGLNNLSMFNLQPSCWIFTNVHVMENICTGRHGQTSSVIQRDTQSCGLVLCCH